MKKEHNPKIRNKSEPENNNQHRQTNTDPQTIVMGQGCSLCVDLGHGIGLVIGLSSLVIPLQLLGIHLVKRWGNKQTLIIGFILLFCLLLLMLVIPMLHRRNATLGFAFLCATIMCMHFVHNATNGVALQPMVRESTRPDERGWFFTNAVGYHGTLVATRTTHDPAGLAAFAPDRTRFNCRLHRILPVRAQNGPADRRT